MSWWNTAIAHVRQSAQKSRRVLRDAGREGRSLRRQTLPGQMTVRSVPVQEQQCDAPARKRALRRKIGD